jgi:hypothetical protein
MKLFTAVIYDCSYKARVFVPDKPSQLSLRFTSKAKAYPSKAPLCAPLWGRLLALLARLEGLVRDKHSSLLQVFVNYVRKKFYKIVPCRGSTRRAAKNFCSTDPSDRRKTTTASNGDDDVEPTTLTW